MAQYQKGTISFTNLGNRAIASADADWSGFPSPTLKPIFISIKGSALWYQISAVKPPGSAGNTTSDRWELLTTGVFGEATNTAAAYGAFLDFEEDFGFALLGPNDVQSHTGFNRNMLLIAAAILAGVGSGSGGIASLGSNAQVNNGSGKFAVRDPDEGNYHDVDVYGSATGNPAIVVNPSGEPQNP